MDDRAEKYANWIVQNQDKKGTPEFEKVAMAYKVMRAGGIDEYANQQVPQAKPQPSPMTFNASGGLRGPGEKFLIGAGKGLSDLAMGTGQALGLVDQPTIDQRKQRDMPIEQSGLGQAGKVVSQTAAFIPTAWVPGANTYTGSALIGAGIGATQPVGSDQSRLSNALIGAGAGVAGRALTGAASRTLNPQTNPQVQALMKEGVTPTPGQVLGGTARRMEEGAKSIPILGDAIRSAEMRSMSDFNRSAINRALAPIGKQVDDVGYKGIEAAQKAISSAYDDVLGKMPVSLDKTAAQNLQKVTSMTGSLAPAQQKRFSQILKERILGRMTSSGKMSGETYKTIDSDLGRLVRSYTKSSDVEQQQLGAALKEVQNQLRSLAGRQNPVQKAALDKADQAYAQLLRIEEAAGGRGAKEGVFSPAQLSGAVKRMSSGKRQTSRGDALMQDLADAGESVLGNKVPDSGTPFRIANMMMGGGALAEPTMGLPVIAGLTAASGAYLSPSQRALAAALTQRPEMIRQLGQQVGKLSPYAAALSAPLSQ